jgi:hypothetical protein
MLEGPSGQVLVQLQSSPPSEVPPLGLARAMACATLVSCETNSTAKTKEGNHDVLTLPGAHGRRSTLRYGGAYGQLWMTSQCCLNCGHVHDAVIAQHRRLQQAKVLVLSTGGPDYQDDEGDLESGACVRLVV